MKKTLKKSILKAARKGKAPSEEVLEDTNVGEEVPEDTNVGGDKGSRANF